MTQDWRITNRLEMKYAEQFFIHYSDECEGIEHNINLASLYVKAFRHR